ncbi:MAG: polyprenyl diphosphate synthase, partial [Phormidesmis sp.]
VCIRFLGDLSGLSPSLQKEIDRAMTETVDNSAIEFNVAINYGSRSEIVQACQQVAQKVEQGELSASAISEDMIAQHLYTAGSDPDLLIRTSGEQRLSNFLLWQLAYTEMYFTDAFWPDFDRGEFHRALQVFQGRDRRFGNAKDGVGIQKTAKHPALTA